MNPTAGKQMYGQANEGDQVTVGGKQEQTEKCFLAVGEEALGCWMVGKRRQSTWMHYTTQKITQATSFHEKTDGKGEPNIAYWFW